MATKDQQYTGRLYTQVEVDRMVEERFKIASTEHTSSDEVVQIAWLADGIDLWHKSGGKMGHSPEKARHYIISSITRYVDRMVREARIDELKDIDTQRDHNMSSLGNRMSEADADNLATSRIKQRIEQLSKEDV